MSSLGADNDLESSRQGFLAAPITTTDNDALDIELLNAFEELQLDDGPNLIVELIDLYLLDAVQRVTQIREALNASEWVLLKRTAHNLKGSSSNLGIRHVAETCKKLEQMDDRDAPETVAVLVRLLEYEFAEAGAALAAVRQGRLD